MENWSFALDDFTKNGWFVLLPPVFGLMYWLLKKSVERHVKNDDLNLDNRQNLTDLAIEHLKKQALGGTDELQKIQNQLNEIKHVNDSSNRFLQDLFRELSTNTAHSNVNTNQLILSHGELHKKIDQLPAIIEQQSRILDKTSQLLISVKSLLGHEESKLKKLKIEDIAE